MKGGAESRKMSLSRGSEEQKDPRPEAGAEAAVSEKPVRTSNLCLDERKGMRRAQTGIKRRV